MQRALNRAYQRVQGNHPRRPRARFSILMDIACDVLLVGAAFAFLGGLAVMVWGLAEGFRFEPLRFLVGLAFLAVSPVLLILWDRLAWQSLIKDLSDLT